ncbi:PAS-domain containing protein [Rhizobium sp. TRM95111]|uniref:PAS domain-containing hybrid sensor histidine kinase/response regulator n=1 Tax=Rhizobium alarense TaxID=2846851 RepID=UPI001F274C3D|nr:PAS-domain containing protein [Rhizobium alarense]MCF3638903.1 PAS-domain containing protein [Rhizobium alarense]
MAEHQDERLADVVAFVEAQAHPAYVKSSEMRFLAVNSAYAELFGHARADFVGLRSDEMGEILGHEDRDEHERRCLIFGATETARYFHPFGGGSFVITMERRRLSEHCAVLVGSFMPATDRLATVMGMIASQVVAEDEHVATLPVLAPAANAGDGTRSSHGTAIESALDTMGAGVAVFGADDRLAYANGSMRGFYRALIGDLADGPVSLKTITTALYDVETARDGGERPQREAWVADRLGKYDLPLFESVSRTAAGWMRLITQRRPDGILVALRMDVTALKESEHRVRQHAQEISLYRALIDELPVASFMRDDQERMVFANRAFIALNGRPMEELVGKTALEMYPEDGEAFHERNQRVLETGELIETEIDYRRPDGALVPTITRLYRVTTLDGKHYLIGSITDTSLLKKRQDQLIEAQRHAEAIRSDLENIVESLQVGIVVIDGNGTIELANGAFSTLWKGALPPMEGRPFGELLRFKGTQGDHAAEDPTCAEQCLCEIRSGSAPAREVSYANGSTLIEAGQPISGGRCLLTFIDITERREREREVLETRSALEDVGRLVKDAVSAMGQGLLIIDGGRVVLANEALFDMVALPRDLLAPGASIDDIFASCEERGIHGYVGDQRIEARQFHELIAPDRHASITILSGLQRWIQLDATPTGHGRLVLVFSDITEMKDREEELRRLVERAEMADKAKSEFLANMSHEIRTPMNGVLGMAELLAKSDLDTRQKTFIDIMVKSGNALLTIINDILDFSKIDAGQMVLRKAPFNPVEAVEDVATLLSAKAAEKDVELIVRSAPDMPKSVAGDAGRFRQIVTNLVGNAVKFTDRGQVVIHMSGRPAGEGRATIEVRVEDTGAGIPADKLASIFEKFSQIDASSTRRHEGTGLGLAITQGLVRLFDGTLTVESTVGRGSVFAVGLPFDVGEQAFVRDMLPEALRGARVLVVDGNDATRDPMRDLLAGWGFDATGVAGEAEARALLAAAAGLGICVDAVILDHVAIDADGAEALSALRRDFPAPALVMLFGAGNAGFGALDALPIDAQVMKPVRHEILFDMLCELVRTRRRRQTQENAVPPPAMRGPEQDKAAAQSPPGAPVDILVAEDNDVNQILFRQMLEGAGHCFTIVTNGAEAVEAYKRLNPRMILMDVSMPVMNGHQASRAIRDIEKATGAHVPIVAVTAHVLDGDRELCFAAGMDDFLSKPISADRLEEMVMRWLSRDEEPALRHATLH